MVVMEKLKVREACTIPVLDFSRLLDPAERSFMCAQIAQAYETVGFFQIVNGFPQKVLDNAFEVSRQFFDLPMEEKLVLRQKRGTATPLELGLQSGYKPCAEIRPENRMERMVLRHFHLSNFCEHQQLEDGCTPTSSPVTGEIDSTKNCWPTNPPQYRTMVERLLAEFGKLSNILLDLFSESLGLPAPLLREEQQKNAVSPYMYCFHYLQGTTPIKDELRLYAHRDSSIFNIVAQGYDAEGLEINPQGEWIPMNPHRGTLVVNVGDVLQAWSNGKFKSILHRVMSNKESDRYSFSYALYPASFPEADVIVEPIPKLITQENPAKYVPFSFMDLFKDKLLVNSVHTLEAREVKSSAGPDAVLVS